MEVGQAPPQRSAWRNSFRVSLGRGRTARAGGGRFGRGECVGQTHLGEAVDGVCLRNRKSESKALELLKG